jgi:hypothetical protein
MHISLLPQPPISRSKQRDVFRLQAAGKVDFFLPSFANDQFNLLRNDPGSLNLFFRLLLGRYRNRILRQFYRNLSSSDDRIRTRYQFSGLALRRVSFPVEEEVWVELRLLSLAVRCSMSLILVQLVQYEYCRRWKFGLRKWDPHIAGQVGTATFHSLTISYSEGLQRLGLRVFFSGSQPDVFPPWYSRPGGSQARALS